MTKLSIKLVVTVLSCCAVVNVARAEAIDYARDLAPLLAEHCLACHGPNQQDRQAGLRLDLRDSATAVRDSGRRAVAPGDAALSELIARVSSTDPSRCMPPPEHGRRLTAAEITLLTKWINEGAVWQPHWSFVAPVKSSLPKLRDRSWPRNAIDHFTAAEMERRGLSPSPQANRHMLARRAALALTGLPPTVDQLQSFLADDSPDAYGRYLDQLFASPRYGEHMALAWLDLARYADTHGFHTDSHRDMWRWRDWVIEAYNSHMPLDRFIVEQMAGDLLPDATLSQRIATGFQRNHMINFENGALAEEYQNLYVVDRVNTTASVFLGLTVSCAQCHDHKYDPISQREYYQLYAFLNNIPELGLDGSHGNAAPLIDAPTPAQQRELASLDREIAEAREAMKQRTSRVEELVAEWEKNQSAPATNAGPATGLTWHFSLDRRGAGEGVLWETITEQWQGKATGNTLFLNAAKHGGGLLLTSGAAISINDQAALGASEAMTLGVWIYPTTADRMIAIKLSDGDSWEIGVEKNKPYVIRTAGDGTATRFSGDQSVRASGWSFLAFRFDAANETSGQFFIDNRPIATTATSLTADGSVDEAIPDENPRRLTLGSAEEHPWRGMLDDVRGYSRALSSAEIADVYGSNPIAEILDTPRPLRSAAQQETLNQHYLTTLDAAYRAAHGRLQTATSRREKVIAEVPTTMVMKELEVARPANLLVRGDYRKRGEVVERSTPGALHAWPADAPRNRLGLARWLIDPANPLTARVFVNRHWMQIFGQPLVATPDDFGSRGAPPTNQHLLDWLAVELIESGWNLQHIQRLMLESATFRQASDASAERLAADPDNQWYTRYSNVPLTGESLRDTALDASGLLTDQIGGRSVFPYQPPGLWEAIAYDPDRFSAQRYTQSVGDDLYRRSIYTFWKRSLPLPTLAVFGAPTRETCVASRSQAVTSAQALVIWNDPTFVEAARHTACRVLTSADAESSVDPIEHLYLLMLSRPPTAEEQAAIDDLLNDQRQHFRAAPAEANKLLAVGDSPLESTHDRVEIAAWLIAAQTVMMTEEFHTRP